MDEDLARAELLIGEAISIIVGVSHRRPDISASLKSVVATLDSAHFWVGWHSRRREENMPPSADPTHA